MERKKKADQKADKKADKKVDKKVEEKTGGEKRFRLFQSMDPEKRKRLVKLAGLAVGAFAVFTLIAIVSYLFTWKADQSLLSDPDMMEADTVVHNSAGKLGFRWGHFLVARCFGLGSFALFLLLSVISMRLLFSDRRMGVVRTFIVTVSGAVISSVFLAYAGNMTGAGNLFEGGLGGDCGAAISAWGVNLVGKAVTLIIILIFIIGWLMFSSRRFSAWLVSAFDRTGSRHQKPDAETAPDEDVTSPAVSGDGSGNTAADDGSYVDGVDDSGLYVSGEGTASEESSGASEDAVSDGEEGSEPASEGMSGNGEDIELSGLSDGDSAHRSIAHGDMAGEEMPEEEHAGGKPDSAEEAAAADTSSGNGIEVISSELDTNVKKELPRINVRDELDKYVFPSLDMLGDYPDGRHEVSQEELERNNNKIRSTLLSYKIQIDKVFACVGPTVTLYKIIPAKGVKISAIKNLEEDIALALGVKDVRIVTLEDAVGIEVANDRPSIVPLKFMLNDPTFRNNKYELPIALGATITNKVKVFDLADSPHLLVAGATKQGKSVGLNVIITSLLYSKHPSELKFVFIDPKMVEFTLYSKLIRHYLAVLPDALSEKDEMDNAIIKKPKQAEAVLKSLCIEMDERYELLSKAEVRNVKEYNNKYRDRHLLPTEGHKFMPYIVVVIDEYADLIMTGGSTGESKTVSKNIMDSIVRLAQKGRAAGIHVILATQRPSTNVVTGMIKSNFPTRIAFRTVSRMDSMVILDSPGAEKLIGRGDMLYYAGVEIERVQCAFVDKEIKAITEFIGGQTGYRQAFSTPYYLPMPPASDGEPTGGDLVDMQNLDPLFEDAAKMVVVNQVGSTSTLQRKLGMGYARAGRVMDQLEAAGIVGPQEGSKPRQVLVPDLDTLQPILKAYMKS